MTAWAGSTDLIGRFFDLYRATATSRSAVVLVVANAIPLVGVLFFGWSLWTILVLYWVENGIVGLWTIPKILLARGSLLPDVSLSVQGSVSLPARIPIANAALAAFFLVHYGLFWVVHGVFVFVLPAFLGLSAAAQPGTVTVDPTTGVPIVVLGHAGGGAFGEIVWSSVAIGAVALLLSQGASFLLNYLRAGEYLRTSAAAQMAAPYGRVVVLHLTILFSAFAMALIGAPIAALGVLVVLKTMLDLGLHLRAYGRAA